MAKKLGWLIPVVLIAVAIVALNPDLLQSFTGTIGGTLDSDLLLISGSPIFMEGQNQPLQGNVVLSNYIVGIGNDIAAVGTYDKEKTSVSALGKTADYFVSAKKVKMETVIKLKGNTKILRNINLLGGESGTKNGYAVGIFLNEAEVQNSIKNKAAPDAYNYCKSAYGSNLAAVAWRPIEQSDIGTYPYSYHSICTGLFGGALGTCSNGWMPQVEFKCYVFGSGSIAYREFGAKTVNSQVDVQLTNNKNQETSILSLTEINDRGYFTSGGTEVGYARLTGMVSSFQLPLDLQGEFPAKIGVAWKLISGSDASQAWNRLTAMQVVPTYTNFMGNYSTIVGNITQYQNTYKSVLDSADTRFSDKWTFAYNAGLDSFVVNDAYSANPALQVIVKGDWLGLIRDVANFEIICPSTVVQGVAQTTAYSSVVVNNLSSVSGSGTLGWSCPTGNNSISTSFSAKQSKTFEVPMNSTGAAAGQCNISFVWDGGNRACGIGYEFKAKPLACGNGVVDAGETCANCSVDVRCGLNEFCDVTAASCRPLELTCGNGKFDAGETCDNCREDLVAENPDACGAPMNWLLVGIIVVIVAIVGFVLLKKKGKRKGRKRR